MATIITRTPQSIGRALKQIQLTKKGLCWKCQKPITEDDDIVSRKVGSTKYYHKPCAKVLRIV